MVQWARTEPRKRGEGHPLLVNLNDLDYDANMPGHVVDRLEEAARGVGLPLRELELLGQDPSTAEAFVNSVQAGRYESFLDGVDWGALEQRLYGSRRDLSPSRGLYPASA